MGVVGNPIPMIANQTSSDSRMKAEKKPPLLLFQWLRGAFDQVLPEANLPIFGSQGAGTADGGERKRDRRETSCRQAEAAADDQSRQNCRPTPQKISEMPEVHLFQNRLRGVWRGRAFHVRLIVAMPHDGFRPSLP